MCNSKYLNFIAFKIFTPYSRFARVDQSNREHLPARIFYMFFKTLSHAPCNIKTSWYSSFLESTTDPCLISPHVDQDRLRTPLLFSSIVHTCFFEKYLLESRTTLNLAKLINESVGPSVEGTPSSDGSPLSCILVLLF